MKVSAAAIIPPFDTRAVGEAQGGDVCHVFIGGLLDFQQVFADSDCRDLAKVFRKFHK